MIIYQERKFDNREKLKAIVSGLDHLATAVNQLAITIGVIQFSESYLGEGTFEDRKFVKDKIMEIKRLILNIQEINLMFEIGDLSSPNEKQSQLKRASVDIEVIRGCMLDIWKMRDSGDTPEDSRTIHEIIGLLFTRVNDTLKMLEQYVSDFNAASHVKLDFNIKWTSLPK